MSMEHNSNQPSAAAAGNLPARENPVVSTWFATLPPRRKTVLLSVLLALLTALTFSAVLHNGFVQWDDDVTIERNPHIQGLDPARLQWMFTDSGYAMRYKPLAWLADALIYEVSGLDPFGYHLVGLLLHCVNAVLVFLVLRQLLMLGFRSDATHAPSDDVLSIAATLGTLLWAVNPLRVEAVVRVTDMAYEQSFLFTLIALGCYLRAVTPPQPGTTGRGRWYAGSVIAFALAMLTYPFVFGFGLVLLAVDYYPLRRFSGGFGNWRDASVRRVYLEKIPFIVLGGIICATLLGRLHPTDLWSSERVDADFGLVARVMQAGYVWTYFLWRPWVPFHLAPVYTTLLDFNPLAWQFVASALAMMGLTLLFFWKRRQWPLALVLWLCHLVLLVTALGLTEHPHHPNDRYSYIPGVLWAVAIAVGFVKLSRRVNYLPRVIFTLILAGVLGWLSFQQSRIWRDTPTLFQHILATLGNHPYRADIYARLGMYFTRQGKPRAALDEFRESVRAKPTSAQMHNVLAAGLLNLGQIDQATAEVREALKLDPNLADAHNTLGAAFRRQGRLPESAVELQTAIRLDPASVVARNNLASLFHKQNRFADAIAEYRESIRLDPDDADTHEVFGVLLSNQHQPEAAIIQFEEALRCRPDDAEAHNAWGVALCNQGKLDAAIAHFNTALKLKPGFTEARNNLAAVLSQKRP